MKVIGNRFENWQRRVYCTSPTCGAVLEVDERDIEVWQSTLFDVTDICSGVTCPDCGKKIRIKELDLPVRGVAQSDS